MSRQRYVWPQLWESRDFHALSRDARLLFVGLFSTADDYGRGRAEPEHLAWLLFRADTDLTAERIDQLLREISRTGTDEPMVRLYRHNGRVYYWLPAWERWQRPRWRSQPKTPEYSEELDLRGSAGGETASGRLRPEATASGRATRVEERREEERRGDLTPPLPPGPHHPEAPPATAPADGTPAGVMDGSGDSLTPVRALERFDHLHRQVLRVPYHARDPRKDRQELGRLIKRYGGDLVVEMMGAFWREQSEAQAGRRTFIGRARPDVGGFLTQIPNLHRDYEWESPLDGQASKRRAR